MNFEEITLRKLVTPRGGGIEISLDSFGYEGHRMTAYQNYLGGGMLGRVDNDCSIENWFEDDKLSEIAEELRKYYFSLTNPEQGRWESLTYEQNQRLRESAY